MSETETTHERWASWVEEACGAVGVDAESVDVVTILAMTTSIAHGVERPMAPVGAYILGLAVGHIQAQGRPVDIDALRAAIETTIIRGEEEQA